jgi:hypothetical protein
MVRRWCSRWWDTRRNRWRQQCSSRQNWQSDRCCLRLAKICCSSCHQGTDLQAAVPHGMRAPGAVPWPSLLIAVGSCQVAGAWWCGGGTCIIGRLVGPIISAIVVGWFPTCGKPAVGMQLAKAGCALWVVAPFVEVLLQASRQKPRMHEHRASLLSASAECAGRRALTRPQLACALLHHARVGSESGTQAFCMKFVELAQGFLLVLTCHPFPCGWSFCWASCCVYHSAVCKAQSFPSVCYTVCTLLRAQPSAAAALGMSAVFSVSVTAAATYLALYTASSYSSLAYLSHMPSKKHVCGSRLNRQQRQSVTCFSHS